MRLIMFACMCMLVLLTHPIDSFSRTHSYAPSSAPLPDQLNQLIRNAHLNMGVVVKSMNTGQVLYQYNESRSFTPASTMKIMTAEAALMYLGGDYRFLTQVYSDQSNIQNGVLKGNIYISQSGDPSLTYPAIQSLIRELKEKGIHTIQGHVYIDQTAFDQNFFGQNWDPIDKQRCYGAPIGAGTVDKNCIHFQLVPARKTGALAEIRRSPRFFYPVIQNQVITKNNRRGHCALKMHLISSNRISLSGCMKPGRYAWNVTYVIQDLSEYNRALFSSVFRQAGIHVTRSVLLGASPKKRYLLAQHASKPLSDLIREMLKKSDNIIASAVFKKLGQLYTQRIGNWQTGSYAVASILSKNIQLPRRGLRIIDGSGLSRDNAASPEQLLRVLELAYRHSSRDQFISSLPIAGVDGTLKHRSGHFARRVYAKTGTMTGIRSLAGYAFNQRNQTIAFAIVFNGDRNKKWQFRKIEDRILDALTHS